jgi:hypothetical protein
VNVTEKRLRDAFRADAETVRPETLPPLSTASGAAPAGESGHTARRVRGQRGRASWRARGRPGPIRPEDGRTGRARRIVYPAAAAAGVTAIVVLAAVLVPRALDSGRAAGQAGRPARGSVAGRAAGGRDALGYPRFFVAADTGTNVLEVRSAVTGAEVARLRAPAGVTFSSVSAAGSPRFVVAGWGASACSTLLYQFRLSPAGRPGPLMPFAGGSVPGDMITNLAVSDSGRILAYGSQSCTAGGPHATATLVVRNLATGHATRWRFPQQQDISSISLSGDGSLLGYTVGETKLFPSLAAVVPTSAPSGPLAGRSHVVVPGQADTNITSAVLSPDGRTLWSVSDRTGPAAGHPPSMNLNATDVRTGFREPSRTLPGWVGTVTAAPGGRWLLLARELTPHVAPPRLDRVRENGDELHRLAAARLADSDAGDELAW